jgi:hypothetical protein
MNRRQAVTIVAASNARLIEAAAGTRSRLVLFQSSDDGDYGHGIHGKTGKKFERVLVLSVFFRGFRGHKLSMLTLSLICQHRLLLS